MAVKSFIVQTPGVNVIKPFNSSPMVGTNKLEHLSLASFLRLVICLLVSQMSYGASLWGKAAKNVLRKNTLAYLFFVQVMNKKFYYIDTWSRGRTLSNFQYSSPCYKPVSNFLKHFSKVLVFNWRRSHKTFSCEFTQSFL